MTEKKEGRSNTDGHKPGICSFWGGLLMFGVVILLGFTATGAESDSDLRATRREVQELKEKVGQFPAMLWPKAFVKLSNFSRS